MPPPPPSKQPHPQAEDFKLRQISPSLAIPDRDRPSEEEVHRCTDAGDGGGAGVSEWSPRGGVFPRGEEEEEDDGGGSKFSAQKLWGLLSIQRFPG